MSLLSRCRRANTLLDNAVSADEGVRGYQAGAGVEEGDMWMEGRRWIEGGMVRPGELNTFGNMCLGRYLKGEALRSERYRCVQVKGNDNEGECLDGTGKERRYWKT